MTERTLLRRGASMLATDNRMEEMLWKKWTLRASRSFGGLFSLAVECPHLDNRKAFHLSCDPWLSQSQLPSPHFSAYRRDAKRFACKREIQWSTWKERDRERRSPGSLRQGEGFGPIAPPNH